MIYIVCVAAGGRAAGWAAFSSRSSPLQIWASIIIDPARAVGRRSRGGRHFLPLIHGAGPTYLSRRAGGAPGRHTLHIKLYYNDAATSQMRCTNL